MILSETIKKERTQRKLTLMNLSKISGVSYATLHRLENNAIVHPKLDVLNKVSNALELNYLDVLYSFGYVDKTYIKKYRQANTFQNKQVISLTDLDEPNPNTLFKAKVSLAENVSIVVKINIKKWAPMVRIGTYIGVRKIKRIKDKTLYIVKKDNTCYIIKTAKIGPNNFFLLDINNHYKQIGSNYDVKNLYQIIFFTKHVVKSKVTETST